MIELITEHKKKIMQLCQKHYVSQLFVFGSTAEGKSRDDSDIDFLVYFKNDLPLLSYADNFFDFMYELEKTLGRKIDMVSGKALKNPYFIQEVEKTKRLVYDSNNQKIAV